MSYDNEKIVFFRREFLNSAGYHSIAAIHAEVNDYNENGIPDFRYGRFQVIPPTSILTISDCDRHITLELGFRSDEEQDNNLHKLDTLISVLTEMRAAVVDAYESKKEAETVKDELVKALKATGIPDNDDRQHPAAMKIVAEFHDNKGKAKAS